MEVGHLLPLLVMLEMFIRLKVFILTVVIFERVHSSLTLLIYYCVWPALVSNGTEVTSAVVTGSAGNIASTAEEETSTDPSCNNGSITLPNAGTQ